MLFSKLPSTIANTYFENFRNRFLSETSIASKFTINGISSIYANKTSNITLIPQDSSGNAISLPSTQVPFILITNECTKGENFNLIPVSGRDVVLDQDVFGKMTPNSDGTYQFTFTATKVGKISIVVYLYSQGEWFVEYFGNSNLSGNNIYNGTETRAVFNYNYGVSQVCPCGRADDVSARFIFLIKAPVDGTLNLQLAADFYSNLDIDNNRIISQYAYDPYNGTINAQKDKFYRANIDFTEISGNAALSLAWSYDGSTYNYISSDYLYSPKYIVQSPILTTVTCETGFTYNSEQNKCIPICGDGIKAGNEKCDDGNTEDGDGCKNDCASIENGYICNGGSQTSKDTCTLCTSGLYPNDIENPSICISHCGDGLKAGNEKCDDGNTEDGDGCSSDCTFIEDGWVCSGGTASTCDFCQYCDKGFYVNDYTNPNHCISKCGDGKREGSEKCDDNNECMNLFSN